MYAALLVIAHVVSNTATAPTQVVLDGCNTASADRVAELARMSPEHPRARVMLAALLDREDGIACLMESESLVSLHRFGGLQDLVERALLGGLRSARPHIAARAGDLSRRLRDLDPSAYDELLRRAGKKGGDWQSFSHGPDPRAPAIVTVAR